MGKARRARKVALSVAAIGVATSIAGVAATAPSSISKPLVDLVALIVVGSSTHPDGSGTENFFGGKYRDPIYTGVNGDDIVHVSFFSGPAGIDRALQANADEPNAVISSGWGSANASFLLRQLNARNDPALKQTLFIFDNDVAMPDGGFGTRYPWFALIGVNPLPTPSLTSAVGAVAIGYEYDYNSSAPADVWNALAAVNSFVAWLDRRLNQSQLDLPVDEFGKPTITCGANTCAITDKNAVLACPDARCDAVPPGDRVAAYVTLRGNTSYVTYTSDGLPVANVIRDVVPFGDDIADATEPLLKTLVDAAYYDGNPIPADPSQYRPARLFPPPNEIAATAAKIPAAIQQGLHAVTSPEPPASSTLVATGDEPPTDEESKPLRNVVRQGDTVIAGSSDPTGADGPATTQPQPLNAPTGEESKPLRNLVRQSDKAVPGSSDLSGAASTTAKDVESPESPNNSVTEEPGNVVHDDTGDSKPDTDQRDRPRGEADRADS